MPELKELLGSAYKEGMTFDEANAALKDRKLVDLESGEYVGKGKYETAVKERDEARKERDDANAKYKDYDDLVKYRDDNEKAKSAKALEEKLTGFGVKTDMAEFVRYQIESGKIERGEKDAKLEENVKKYLKDNPQYAAEQKKTLPSKPTPTHVSTGGEGGGGSQGGYTPPKRVQNHPWNHH